MDARWKVYPTSARRTFFEWLKYTNYVNDSLKVFHRRKKPTLKPRVR